MTSYTLPRIRLIFGKSLINQNASQTELQQRLFQDFVGRLCKGSTVSYGKSIMGLGAETFELGNVYWHQMRGTAPAQTPAAKGKKED